MANPALMQKQNGKHLWFALLGLGFQQDAALSSNVVINVKHANLGPNMFDKPNKGAFYIVTRFLLEKLNPTRFHEAFRNCWPVLNHKLDAEFRKVTCSWLREIMDEAAGAGSKVVASLFLSPGGPKFISLMVDLANHVILQEMKTFTTDGSWVPEAAAMPASSLDMEMKRLNLISARFLKAAVYQDRFYHEYQRRAQLLVKSMRDNRAEGAKYDEPLKYRAQKTFVCPKVRSFWSAIDEMLLAIKENQNAVGSVLKGHVDQYVLDGTDRVLKIPQSLLERIEQLPHQLSSGSLYEAGQLNILCVLELMNHALQLLRDERCRVPDAPKAQLSPQDLQDKCQQMSRVLQDLHLLRQKISKEEIPEVRSSIRQLETEWDRKWMDVLKDTPLVSFLNEDPALGFLSPMAPLSFEPVAEASYTNSVFSQYPAKLLGEQNQSLLHYIYVRKTTHVPPKVAPMRLNTRILDMECDNLADQFADAVATASPTEGRVKGLDLEGLLSTLHGDPFSARKQLPRTPESLIMDVKSSWRKALEENKAEKIQHSPNLTNSIMHHLSPLGPSASSQTISGSIIPTATSHSDPPVYKQDVSLKSSLLWDTFNTELPDSPSGTGSSAMHFTLDHETLPEMPSCDSLLSLDDESVNMKSEQEDELLLPPLTAEAKKSPLTTRRQLQQAFDGGSFMDNRKTMPVCLLSGHVVSDKVFSLDLEKLETHSPPQKQEYSFPKLITFSPIDDMKC
uniref:HAUS augmin-like complex, subunit 6 n=1 Tax=Mastacembelus armatus TaxID=205130 RepID=A0A7N8XPV9_9TELE